MKVALDNKSNAAVSVADIDAGPNSWIHLRIHSWLTFKVEVLGVAVFVAQSDRL
jgi:hypothetical protein